MLSKFSVKKPYTVVVSVVLIIILGFVSFREMTVDLLPSMNLPYAIVMTTYVGASPEEVETIVTKPVEQAMATISNIKTVSSASQENASTVMLEFEQSANMDSATIEMRETLDQISGYWPDAVGNPLIMKLNPDMMPIMVAALGVEGADPAETTKRIQEEVIPELESLEGVASVSVYGEIEESVRVTLKDDKVSSVDERVQAQLEQKFQEASDALSSAKAQVESGKSQLQAGQKAAADGMTQAEKELAQKEAEVSQGQLEVQERLSEVSVAEAALNQSLAVFDSSEKALREQREELVGLKEREGQLQADYQTVLSKIAELEAAGMEVPEELAVAKATYEAQLALLQNYDATMQTIDAGLAEIEVQKASITEKQAELAQAREMLQQMQEQLKAGSMALSDARAQMSGAQITAALQMSEASAQLAVGEATVQQKEEELKAAKDSARDSADMSKILTGEMLQTLLAAQNFSMPAGYVTEEGLDYLIRVGDKFDSVEDIGNLVLVDQEDITPIRLSDVADVERLSNEDETYARINGDSGILLQIQKQTGYSTGDVSDRILDRLGTIEKEDPELQNVVLMDQGVYIDLIVNSVLQNLLFGALLAIAILLLFLRSVRSTFIIACSIPISLMTAIVLMYFSGVTLNIISLSGLALGVGMLVDNSIVVIENIFRMRNEEGRPIRDAAIQGARQVAGAIAASTLTTVCVFVPIVFTEGITRQLFVDMALTIGYSLLASLLIALTLVPMMAAGLLKKTKEKEGKVFGWLRDRYASMLRVALHVKPLVLIGALALFIGSIVLATSRGTEFMPEMTSTEISMTMTTAKDSTLEETAAIADSLTERVQAFEDVGDMGGIVMGNGLMGSGEAVTNQVSFYALLNEERTMSDEELKAAIEKIGEEMDVEMAVSMSNMDMSALGTAGISIQIKGRDLDQLQTIAGDIAKIVEQVEGTQNVSDGMEETTEELRVIVDKEKAVNHNLTVAQVYQELAARLREASSTTTLELDATDLDIVVREQSNEELTREDIRNMKLDVTAQDGSTSQVALKDVATFEEGQGLQSISRTEQSRYISVTAEVADGDNIGLVSSRVQDALQDYTLPEGYTIQMTGEDETIREAMVELFKMLALAIVFMYLIMVAQFQSLRSPFIVMFTVPLAFTGGLLGLWITGNPVSVIAMIGFVMLAGIIVNNGIVFIDYANQLIESGLSRKVALIETGRTRLRPIIMTALTTILGLSTMALGFGQGADMVQPMAVVTIGGLTYGTLLTLFVVPCIYDLFHTVERHRRGRRPEETPDD